MTFDRRDFMIGGMAVAGGAVLAPALKFSTAQAGTSAAAQGGQNQAYYKTKIGSLTVTTILDGNMEMPDALFTGARPEILKQAKSDYFLEAGQPFPSFVNTYHISTGKKSILIDTGAQGFAATLGHTKAILQTVAGGAGQIDDVILTHAHPDHTNGLLDPEGRIAFKKAVVKISEAELNFWFDDTQMAKYAAKKQLFDAARKNLSPYKASGQLQTFKFDADLGNGLSSVALSGHTPGHSGIMVADGNDQMLIWGDIVHNAYLQFDHPEQSLAFDTDEDAARTTRLKVFDRAAHERLRIGGMHLPFTALGHVAKRGKGYAFVPQRWEATL